MDGEEGGDVRTAGVSMTNGDRIGGMTDEQLASVLCLTGWQLSEWHECLVWLRGPVEEFMK